MPAWAAGTLPNGPNLPVLSASSIPHLQRTREAVRKKGLHEKSYPSNAEDQSLPIAKNAHEHNGNDVWNRSCTEKKGENPTRGYDFSRRNASCDHAKALLNLFSYRIHRPELCLIVNGGLSNTCEDTCSPSNCRISISAPM